MYSRNSKASVLGALVAFSLTGCHLYFGDGEPPEVEPEQPFVPQPDPPVVSPNPGAAPVSGGTLLITSGQLALAADVDSDVVWVIDTRDDSLRGAIELGEGAEPGRLVEDADGRVHVVLRDAGKVATLDLDNLQVAAARSVCPAPRGIAHDARTDVLHIACMGGELVTLPTMGLGSGTQTRLPVDLRDVVMDGDFRLVSRFTSAEVLVVDDAGAIVRRIQPEVFTDPHVEGKQFIPSVAWRALPYFKGGMAMLHQRAQKDEVDPEQGYGGDGCAPGIVHSTVTVAHADGRSYLSTPLVSLLAVDVAIDPARRRGAMAMAGGLNLGGQEEMYFAMFFDADKSITDEDDPDDDPDDPDPCDDNLLGDIRDLQGQGVAVAFDESARLLVQTRAPHGIAIFDPLENPSPQRIDFPISWERDPGNQLFHSFSEMLISCASCHPEGRQDSHTWEFVGLGPRRTQGLRGGLLGTEPFHWSGDMSDIEQLMAEVFGKRMFHAPASQEQVEAVAMWLDGLTATPASPATDAVQLQRGRALFEDAEVGCASCHSGPLFTNNLTVDVGTGEPMQVPRLIGVWAREPLMHDGCAATLADRFGPCGGGDMHGKTSHLSAAQIEDLIAYVQTL